MNLKTVHILFISVCLVFGSFFTLWSFRHAQTSGESAYQAVAGGSAFVTVALAMYLVWFIKKIKKA